MLSLTLEGVGDLVLVFGVPTFLLIGVYDRELLLTGVFDLVAIGDWLYNLFGVEFLLVVEGVLFLVSELVGRGVVLENGP